MDIQQFIKYINERNHWHIDTGYYAHIGTWHDWWNGYYKPVHEYQERGLDGNAVKRTMYRLRMAKKVCEDWAGLLLNDKTTLAAKDAATQKWLQGETQTDGVFKTIQFWPNSNSLVEKAFWSGTGAWVMSVEHMTQQNGNIVLSPNASIQMDYLPASGILPITVRRGKIEEAAFLSECTLQGEACLYLQVHAKGKDGTYQIQNQFFKEQTNGSVDSYTQAAAPDGIMPIVNTGCPHPWFAIFSPALDKNIPGGDGLGISVFSEAIDQVEGTDRAYNNFLKDIHLGGKKVFYNRKLLETRFDGEGNPIVVTPDDVQQQLFIQAAENDSLNEGGGRDIYEYNPSLRVEENIKAIQCALDCLSFKCGLGTHHYRFEGGSITTATQYNGDRQDMVQSANRHQTPIETAMLQIVRAVLWAGRYILGAQIDPDTELTVNWDDSYITDSETRREQDRQDVRDGMWPRYRYLMEWRGMSEDAAKKAVSEAMEEGAQPELSFGGDG